MYAEWKPSDNFKSQYFVATGKRLASAERIEFDPTTLTPEQRELLLKCREGIGSIWILPQGYEGVESPYKTAEPRYVKSFNFDVFEAQPTIADWLQRAEVNLASKSGLESEHAQMYQAYQGQVRDETLKSIAGKVARIKNFIAARSPFSLSANEEISCDELNSAKKAGVEVDLTEYEAVRKQFNELLPLFKSEQEARDKEEEADKEAAKEAERQMRLAWAIEHGSERLVKGLQAGYNCNRLYKLERAKFEFPSYTLDLQNNCEWEERNNPALAALNERAAMLAAHPELSESDVSVVWLTAPALTNALKRDEDDEEEEEEEEEFAPREAVMIDSADFTEWLVKII